MKFLIIIFAFFAVSWGLPSSQYLIGLCAPLENQIRNRIICPSENSFFDCPSDCIKRHGKKGGDCEAVTNYCICSDSGNSTMDASKGATGGDLVDLFVDNLPQNAPGFKLTTDEVCINDCLCFHNRNGGKVDYVNLTEAGFPPCICNEEVSPGCPTQFLQIISSLVNTVRNNVQKK